MEQFIKCKVSKKISVGVSAVILKHVGLITICIYLVTT